MSFRELQARRDGLKVESERMERSMVKERDVMKNSKIELEDMKIEK